MLNREEDLDLSTSFSGLLVWLACPEEGQLCCSVVWGTESWVFLKVLTLCPLRGTHQNQAKSLYTAFNDMNVFVLVLYCIPKLHVNTGNSVCFNISGTVLENHFARTIYSLMKIEIDFAYMYV